ncbi:MAG: hypothetical protein AAF614_16170 [Chloroflexota bacterium]
MQTLNRWLERMDIEDDEPADGIEPSTLAHGRCVNQDWFIK